MIYYKTEKQYAKLYKEITICYWCGRKVEKSDDDHVPPRSIFRKTDRRPVIKLPCHKLCNNEQSGDDQKISEIIKLLCGSPSFQRTKYSVSDVTSDGKIESIIINDFDFKPSIFRWIRAFHLLLYKEHLPQDTKRFILPPALQIMPDGQGSKIPSGLYRQVSLLRSAYMVQEYDGLSAYNGQLNYKCVWNYLPNSGWHCVFGVSVYNWHELSAPHGGEIHGCFGYYKSSILPAMAATSAKIMIPSNNKSLLPLH